MPYIPKNERAAAKLNPITAGELNYAITTFVIKYLNDQGTTYHTLNNAIGALECAKLELYRRVVAHYEDQKLDENGDVY